jgi:hypothetical protein
MVAFRVPGGVFKALAVSGALPNSGYMELRSSTPMDSDSNNHRASVSARLQRTLKQRLGLKSAIGTMVALSTMTLSRHRSSTATFSNPI